MPMKDFGIDRLPPDERAELALEIWESLESPPIPPMTDELRAELDRRDAELDGNPEIAISREQLRSRMQSWRR